jgi:hypothetical protein
MEGMHRGGERLEAIEPSLLAALVPLCMGFVDGRERMQLKVWRRIFVRRAESDQDGFQYQNLARLNVQPVHDKLWKYQSTVTMVYYFTSNTVSPAAFIYVGKDKVESKIFFSWARNITNIL